MYPLSITACTMQNQMACYFRMENWIYLRVASPTQKALDLDDVNFIVKQHVLENTCHFPA